MRKVISGSSLKLLIIEIEDNMETEKRIITERQEEAIRLCHHDFGGLTKTKAAEKMGITHQAVTKLLAKVEKVAPQLFPLVTKFQAKCYHHLCCDGMAPIKIAKHLDRSRQAVYEALQACKDKGLPLPRAHGNIMNYKEGMDGEIKHKF